MHIFDNIFILTDANIPETIMNIKTLERLVIPYHAFKSVPECIQNLTKLECLDVSHNPCLETVSAQLATLSIKGEINLAHIYFFFIFSNWYYKRLFHTKVTIHKIKEVSSINVI